MLTKVTIRAYAADAPSTYLGEWACHVDRDQTDQAAAMLRAQHRAKVAPDTPPLSRTFDPQVLTFRFTLDGTGVLRDNRDVAERIRALNAVAFSYDQEIHAPNVLDVTWGQVVFRAQLTSLPVEYTMFASDGRPLRAVLTATFHEV